MVGASKDTDALEALLSGTRHVAVPSRDEQLALAKAVAAGDAEARDTMIVANLRLVVSVAKRFSGRGVEMADLVHEGVFGLMRVVDRFDWEKGFQFSTYAAWWIRQAMQRAVESNDTIVLPVEVAEIRAKLDFEKATLTRELGRAPSTEELSERVGVKPGRLAEMVGAARVTASLDQPLDTDGEGLVLGNVVGVEDAALADVEADLIDYDPRTIVDGLCEPDRRVVRMRFGFDTGEPASYTTIARRLGHSVRMVRRCERRALEALGYDPAVVAAYAA